ncbi:MAG: carbamate kinase [Halobacteriales archaeon]
MSQEPKRLVLALGGNAVLSADDPTADGQRRVVERTARTVAEATGDGDEVVVTHGNGPQVGNRMLQQDAAPETPRMPLDVLVAETQGQLGYMLQQAFDNESGNAATVVTQTVVDADDPAFDEPTKPVGPFYDADEAEKAPFETREYERGHRRVVASPEPRDIVESGSVRSLVEEGVTVICGGGGGVPVVRDDGLNGLEAVVDKDRTSRLVAEELDADALVFVTDVDHAYVGYGSDDERAVGCVDTDELRRYLEAGEFGEGTMLPKVESALGFVEEGDGREAVITSPDELADALADGSGTRVR